MDLTLKSSLFRAGTDVGKRKGVEESAKELVAQILGISDPKRKMDKYPKIDAWIESMYANLRKHGVNAPPIPSRL